MKKYTNPVVEIQAFDVEDIITISNAELGTDITKDAEINGKIMTDNDAQKYATSTAVFSW